MELGRCRSAWELGGRTGTGEGEWAWGVRQGEWQTVRDRERRYCSQIRGEGDKCQDGVADQTPRRSPRGEAAFLVSCY